LKFLQFLQFCPFGDQSLDDPARDTPPLLANSIAQLWYPWGIGAARAIYGLGRDVETGHDAWELAHKMQLGDIGGKAKLRYKNQTAPICGQQLVELNRVSLRLSLHSPA
jgi:hypothetical protein